MQTNYTNAFAQATLEEEVYMEIPHDFHDSWQTKGLEKMLFECAQSMFAGW